MPNTGNYSRGWKKRYRAEKAERRRKKGQGVNRQPWWEGVHDGDARQARRDRARKFHKLTKAKKTAGRISLSKEARYQKQQCTDFRNEQRRCPRRAILMHPDGAVSPMKLLAYTTHPDGVIGSLLGGTPQLLACLPAAGIVLMGLQDTICDDEWSPEAYALLRRIRLQKHVGKIYGRALCARLVRHSSGRVMLGDLPLTTYVTGDCSGIHYVRQSPAAPPESASEHDVNSNDPSDSSDDDISSV